MEKILEKLLSGEGKLSLLLIEARPYAEDAKDDALIDLIEKESDGYSSSADLPEYRKIQSQIIGDIKDKYGQLQYQGKVLDFSVLADTVGIDLSVSLVPDSIGFIEDALHQLTGQMAQRPIPNQLVKMLNETFRHNNPHLNLVSAAHEFGTAALQFILTKVRQDVARGLQRINRQRKNASEIVLPIIESVIEDTEANPKTVFVTYAWGDDEYNGKVISFTDFLRQKGYDASMDRKASQEQTSINFNKMMIEGIQNSQKVIVLLDTNYKEKADKFEGGVGVEMQIILEEIKTNPNKFIFASFGQNKIIEITPTGIMGREVLNLKKDQDETNFNLLFAKLESKNIIQFSDVKRSTRNVNTIEIKPFKL